MFENIRTNQLSYKDLFNFGFDIFCKNIKPIIPLVILVNLPILLIQYFAITDDLISQYNNIYDMTLLFIENKISVEAFTNLDLSPLYIMLLFSIVEMAIFSPLLFGGLTSLIIATVKNEKGADMNDMLQGSIRIIFKLTLTALFWLLSVTIGTMMFVLPGVFFAIAFSFSYQAVAMTGKFGLGAAKESLKIISGKWLNVLGLLILVSLFIYAYGSITTGISALIYRFIPYFSVLNITLELVFSVFLAYFQMVICLWYVNRYYVNINFENSIEASL